MCDKDEPRDGVVYLVGAGPGAPELISLRAVEVLHRADVVLYDYLVSPQILRHASEQAEKVCLGRHGGGRIWEQGKINAKLVELAGQGKTVVRLKGGDPAIFARGAEEVDVLARHGIRFEVVPGITAALAAGSYAGVPLTHRDKASAVAFVTGQQRPDAPAALLDYDALAHFPGTLVFYMAVTTAPVWTAALLDAGKPPDTPAMIVRRCSLPDQVTIRCELSEVSGLLHPGSKLRPPVIVIVGDVVDLAPADWWFAERPLFGTSVLVTRPVEQAGTLCDLLAEQGADVIVQPAIRIDPPVDWTAVDAAIAELDEYDWIVFSSSNGVRFFLDRLEQVGRDVRALGRVRIAAIGPGTAEQLAEYHLVADSVPQVYRAESLAESLADAAERGERFLLARASRGREVLAERLTACGGEVTQIVVYTSQDVVEPAADVRERIVRGEVDWVTVTSSAIARSLASMFGDLLNKSRLASISPVTSATLRELGFEPAAEAKTYTMQGVADAIVGRD